MQIKWIVAACLASGFLFSGCCKDEPKAPECPVCEDCAASKAAVEKTKEVEKELILIDVEETNDMNEVFNFFKAVGTYYIATVEGDQPRVRAFGTIDLFEDKLYIQSGKKKNVAKQIAINPKIEMIAFDDHGKWMRLAAEAVGDERIEAQKHMLDAYPQLANMYQPGDGNNIVYALKNVTVTVSSFGKPDRVIKF